MIRPVIHDSHAPSDLPLPLRKESSSENETKIAQPLVGVHGDLLLAVVVLGKAGHFDEKARSPTTREVGAFVFIPVNSPPRRLGGLFRVNGVLEGGAGSLLRFIVVRRCGFLLCAGR